MHRVLGILGASYSGSTALGYLLNTSDKVIFVSEIKRLFEGVGSRTPCAMCGADCKFWTAEFKKECAKGGPGLVYELVSKRSGCDLIVDGSKMPYFYRRSTIEDESRNVYGFLIAKKHPIRLVASYFYNNYLKERYREVWATASLGEISRLQGDVWGDFFFEVLSDVLAKLENVYNSISEYSDAVSCPSVDVYHEEVENEDFVKSMESVIVQFFGISCELNGSSLSAKFCHPLGGNIAPLWNAQAKYGRETGSEVGRRGYYRTARGLIRDDKYAELFTKDNIERILERPDFRRLCEAMGYGMDAI